MTELKARKGPNLRKLEYYPDMNPLVEPHEIELKKRRVSTGLRRDLADPTTGEITHSAMIHTVEDKDDAEFVKVFAAGVQAIYELSRTAHRVFQTVLDEYQKTPMSGGFADCLYLPWFGGGISGRDVGMSESTFQRGLKELLAKGFLAPRGPAAYWVNPSLFFKGDRVAFVREYRRKASVVAPAVKLEGDTHLQTSLLESD